MKCIIFKLGKFKYSGNVIINSYAARSIRYFSINCSYNGLCSAFDNGYTLGLHQLVINTKSSNHENAEIYVESNGQYGCKTCRILADGAKSAHLISDSNLYGFQQACVHSPTQPEMDNNCILTTSGDTTFDSNDLEAVDGFRDVIFDGNGFENFILECEQDRSMSCNIYTDHDQNDDVRYDSNTLNGTYCEYTPTLVPTELPTVIPTKESSLEPTFKPSQASTWTLHECIEYCESDNCSRRKIMEIQYIIPNKLHIQYFHH